MYIFQLNNAIEIDNIKISQNLHHCNSKNSPVMGWGGLSEMSNVKISRSLKDVKHVNYMSYVKSCQMSKSQTPWLWMRFTKNKLDTMRFIHNEVNFEAKYEDIENAQINILWTFWRFSVMTICHLKIDLIVCKPHCVKLNFLWTSSIAKVFGFLTFEMGWAPAPKGVGLNRSGGGEQGGSQGLRRPGVGVWGWGPGLGGVRGPGFGGMRGPGVGGVRGKVGGEGTWGRRGEWAWVRKGKEAWVGRGEGACGVRGQGEG